VFVTNKNVLPSVGGLNRHQSLSMISRLVLPSNLRLSWKGLSARNAPVYHAKSAMMAEESFLTLSRLSACHRGVFNVVSF
jgi:hypothetical protein